MINWELLLVERNAWVDHNFPPKEGDPPAAGHSILGVIEEMGELCHAHLKDEQNIRGAHVDHVDDMRDAIGDLTVYLLGVMNQHGAPQGTAAPRKPPTAVQCLFHLADEVGRLCMNPCTYYCERIVITLAQYCEFWDWDYEEIVVNTWTAVKRRDWMKFPNDGLSH